MKHGRPCRLHIILNLYINNLEKHEMIPLTREFMSYVWDCIASMLASSRKRFDWFPTILDQVYILVVANDRQCLI